MNKSFIFPCLLLTLFITSCASLTTGQDQVISVETPNCPNATCRISNNEGTYYVNRTPGTITINKSGSNLNVVCGIPGENIDEAIFQQSNVEGLTWGNILIGGIIGAAVDFGTGAAYEYPSLITHPLDCRGDITNKKFIENKSKTKFQRLEELKNLFQNGLISEESYQQRQKEILRD